MRIVLLTRSLNYGGAERQLVTLARGLAERGHEVAVVVCYSGGPLQGELADAGVTVHDLAKGHRWDVFGFLARLIRTLRAAKPDVVHGYLVLPNLLTVLVRPFLGSARIVWGVRASNMDFSRYDTLSRVTFTASCILSRYADRIVANSQAGARFHQAHGFPGTNMVTIPNGIDTERFAPDLPAGRTQRATWDLDATHTVVGMVGRLDPMKDHPAFLAAARELVANGDDSTDFRFALVGDGPPEYRQQLIAMVERFGLTDRVVWAGALHDMRAVFNAFDVAVSSSAFGEGFPNVVAEALACGVPCVTTDVGDAAIVVGPQGSVVAPGDSTALAAAVLAILNTDAESLNQRQRVCEEFSVKRLIDRTELALRDPAEPSVSEVNSARAGA